MSDPNNPELRDSPCVGCKHAQEFEPKQDHYVRCGFSFENMPYFVKNYLTGAAIMRPRREGTFRPPTVCSTREEA